MTKEYIKYYDVILEKWGFDSQLVMAVEEMSEIIKEICKFKRHEMLNQDNTKTIENIKEEIADSLNMLEQLEHIFGEEEIEKIRKQKFERTMKIIEGGK